MPLHSDQQSTGLRSCSHIDCHVPEVSFVGFTSTASLSIDCLHTQPVFRRHFVSAATGAGRDLVMPDLFKDHLIRSLGCGPVSVLDAVSGRHGSLGANDARYVKDILESTPSSLEQVKIEPDGRWADASGTEPSAAGNINAGDSRDGNDDDELLEIRSTRINDLRSTPNTKTPPATVDRSSTTYTEPPRSGASKRSHDQIIDLTLSDEEDSVAPGGKRPALNWTPSVPKPGSFSGGTASASSNPSSGVRLSLHPPTQRFHSLPSGSPIPPAPGRET